MKVEFVPYKHNPKYLIGNDGTVKRPAYTSKRKIFYPEKIQAITSGTYPVVCVDGKGQRVHRLIAEYFIPNPDNKPEVNHINGDKSDFRIENLEWVTRTENQRHSWAKLNRKAVWTGKTGFEHHAGIAVKKCTLDGKLIESYGSMRDAAIKNGYHSYTVQWAIEKKQGLYKGNYWCYGG